MGGVGGALGAGERGETDMGSGCVRRVRGKMVVGGGVGGLDERCMCVCVCVYVCVWVCACVYVRV